MTLLLEAEPEQAERQVVSTPRPDDRFPGRIVAVSIAVSIALRIRFIATPLSADEGGYLAVARAWASGKSLYTDAWVDRPQGLLLLFRGWDGLTGGSPEAIRTMAIVFGCIAVLCVAYVAFALAGRRAAIVASLLVAVASSNARIEGFIANGELLAGAIAAAGVAAACTYLFRDRSQWWLFASGALAGCAMSLKQSGFDGFLAVMVCVLVGGFTGERTWRQVLREGALCLAGLATVLIALVVDGIVLGFSAWWYAVAGYRIGGLNASDADWDRFWITSHIAAPTILPLALIAIAGALVWLVRDRRIRRATVLLPAWVLFSTVAFLTGGLFHRHYWITLTFPLACAAAVAIAPRRRPRLNGVLLIAAICLVTIPSVVSTVRVIELDRDDAAIAAHDDPRPAVDERIGQWYTDNRTADSTLYAMCASAGMYAAADAIPPYPYLWLDGVQHGKDAQVKLIELFSGENAPTFVAVYQDASLCNPSGQVKTLLQQRYSTITAVDGARILALHGTP
jgi:Dolichyl-phosphate-mannose-protein mannosyltransferase